MVPGNRVLHHLHRVARGISDDHIHAARSWRCMIGFKTLTLFSVNQGVWRSLCGLELSVQGNTDPRGEVMLAQPTFCGREFFACAVREVQKHTPIDPLAERATH